MNKVLNLSYDDCQFKKKKNHRLFVVGLSVVGLSVSVGDVNLRLAWCFP